MKVSPGRHPPPINTRSVKSTRAPVIQRVNGGPKPKVNFAQRALSPSAVLIQDKTRTVLEMKGRAGGCVSPHWKSLDIRVCYCAPYGQCRVNRSGSSVDSRVSHCPNDLESGFDAGREKPSTNKVCGAG